MRSSILIVIVIVQCVFALVQPRLGLYAYIWFGLMRPDYIAFAPGRHDLSAILAVITLVSAARYFYNAIYLLRPVPILMIAFIALVGISAYSGYFPVYSMAEFNRYLRMWIMCLLIPILITEEAHFRQLFLITSASLGFMGLWWGFTAGIRGMRIWYGPGGFMSDNNGFAIAMAMVVPFLWHARSLVKPFWLKVIFASMMMGSVVVVILTYSRGGALALAAVFILLMMRSKYRIRSIALVLAAVIPVLAMVGVSYKERLTTIETYQEDSSAVSRIVQMKIAYEIWEMHPTLGIGIGDQNYLYASRPYLNKEDANVIVHNSFLQVLVHTGLVGFVLFTALYVGALWSCWRSGRELWKTKQENAVYPITVFVSLVAYGVASMVHPRAWFDFYYMLLMYSTAWNGIVRRQKQAEAPQILVAIPEQRPVRIENLSAISYSTSAGATPRGVTERKPFVTLPQHGASYRDLFGRGQSNITDLEFPAAAGVHTVSEHNGLWTSRNSGGDEQRFRRSRGYSSGQRSGIFLRQDRIRGGSPRNHPYGRFGRPHNRSVGDRSGWLLGPLLSRILFQTPEYTIYCRVMFINFSLSFAQEMGLALLRVQNRSGLYVRILTARLLLLVSLNVTLLTVFHLGALAMLLGSAASSLVTLMYLDARNLLGVRWHFRFGLLKQQLRYAYPLGLSAIGMTFIHSGDRFFLQRYVSLAEVGLYGMAYKFGTLAGYAQPIFETYWNAQIFQVMKLESGARHYVRIMTYFALTLGASAVVVGLFSQPVVRLTTPKQFHAAMALCPLIAAAYAWRAVGDYFRNAFAVHRRTGKNVLVTLSGVVLGGITYSLLIPPLKLWGAAIATAITFIGMSLISYREAQKVYHYAFEWRRLWTIVICSLVVLLPCPWLGHLRILYQFLCAGLLTLLFPVLLWCSGFFEQEELQVAGKYLRQGRLFLMRKAGIAVV